MYPRSTATRSSSFFPLCLQYHPTEIGGTGRAFTLVGYRHGRLLSPCIRLHATSSIKRLPIRS